MPIMLKGFEGIRAHAGFALGKSQWICVTDAMRTAFWLAVDAQEGCSGESLRVGKVHSGDQIAHEFHALSLLAPLLEDVFLLEDVVVGQSYALQEVRFLAPVPVNSSVRLSVKLAPVEFNDEQVVLSLECSMECDATLNPVLFAKVCLQCSSMKTRTLSLPSKHDRLQPRTGS
jgi:acyl dehydratase